MPPEVMHTLPGYGPDVQRNLEEARQIMESLGYGPDKRLVFTLSARNMPVYRDPPIIMLSQLKEIYIDAEVQIIETVQWYPKIMRRATYSARVPAIRVREAEHGDRKNLGAERAADQHNDYAADHEIGEHDDAPS
jgi:ABC-type transport system substrate-binding protein